MAQLVDVYTSGLFDDRRGYGEKTVEFLANLLDTWHEANPVANLIPITHTQA